MELPNEVLIELMYAADEKDYKAAIAKTLSTHVDRPYFATAVKFAAVISLFKEKESREDNRDNIKLRNYLD